MSATMERLAPVWFTIALFALWEAACRLLSIDPFILPAPSEVFAALVQYWRPVLRHSLVTLWTTMAGFALAVVFGIALGLVVGWSRTIYRGIYPVLVGFNTIPKVAVVPPDAASAAAMVPRGRRGGPARTPPPFGGRVRLIT